MKGEAKRQNLKLSARRTRAVQNAARSVAGRLLIAALFFALILSLLFLPVRAAAACGGIYGGSKGFDEIFAASATAADQKNNIDILFKYQGKTFRYVQKDDGRADIFQRQEMYKRGFYLSAPRRAELLKRIFAAGFSKEDAINYVCFDLKDAVQKIEKSINSSPTDSKIKFNPKANAISSMFSYSREKDGFTVARAELYNMLFDNLCKDSGFTLNIPISVSKPQYTRKFWTAAIKERAAFYSSYASSTDERKHNVALALSKFNGLAVQPKQRISFNKIVGARTEQRGYKMAKIIIEGAYEDGIGGGVCQASTTLYNALLLSGLKVDRRFQHTLCPSYVPPSFDAMVNSGGCDLVFTNDTALPIFIKTVCDGENVGVIIYGAKNEYKIVRRHEITKITPHEPEKIIVDKEGKYFDKVQYSDQTHFVQIAKDGITSVGYLDYYENGRFVKTVKLKESVYKPQQAILVKGFRKRPPPILPPVPVQTAPPAPAPTTEVMPTTPAPARPQPNP
jgi:vancomycin resistance protein YoaR